MTINNKLIEKPGTVFWITGLSGVGKTLLGGTLVIKLRELAQSPIFLDGDLLRTILGVEGGHSYTERKCLAMIYSRLCKELSDQGFDVVIATISLFQECHRWNREHISRYFEIYVRASEATLQVRDRKGIYRTEANMVVGRDIPFEEPKHPDLTIFNEGKVSVSELVEKILELKFTIRKGNDCSSTTFGMNPK